MAVFGLACLYWALWVSAGQEGFQTLLLWVNLVLSVLDQSASSWIHPTPPSVVVSWPVSGVLLVSIVLRVDLSSTYSELRAELPFPFLFSFAYTSFGKVLKMTSVPSLQCWYNFPPLFCESVQCKLGTELEGIGSQGYELWLSPYSGSLHVDISLVIFSDILDCKKSRKIK